MSEQYAIFSASYWYLLEQGLGNEYLCHRIVPLQSETRIKPHDSPKTRDLLHRRFMLEKDGARWIHLMIKYDLL